MNRQSRTMVNCMFSVAPVYVVCNISVWNTQPTPGIGRTRKTWVTVNSHTPSATKPKSVAVYTYHLPPPNATTKIPPMSETLVIFGSPRLQGVPVTEVLVPGGIWAVPGGHWNESQHSVLHQYCDRTCISFSIGRYDCGHGSTARSTISLKCLEGSCAFNVC